ncbi:RCC1 domain-containing protein [Actinoplanes sp. NPDC026619]|uniref:RCC1 domain-containing protein n=1 Tax=Actinoplanes sp. NPDC026619 TaxID=3155798 RepID=UPI0033E2BA14
MRIMRRVLAILALVGVVGLVGPASMARADQCAGECRARLVQVGLRGRVVQLVADGDSTCALTEAGDVYCWGAGYPEPYRSGRNPLLLVMIGVLLLAGGATMVMLSRSSLPEPHPGTHPPPA